jgi:hypothetical protein
VLLTTDDFKTVGDKNAILILVPIAHDWQHLLPT